MLKILVDPKLVALWLLAAPSIYSEKLYRMDLGLEWVIP